MRGITNVIKKQSSEEGGIVRGVEHIKHRVKQQPKGMRSITERKRKAVYRNGSEGRQTVSKHQVIISLEEIGQIAEREEGEKQKVQEEKQYHERTVWKYQVKTSDFEEMRY